MKELIIAEKREAGLAIATAISGKVQANKHYAIGEDGRLYTWAVGHLVKIAEPKSYSEKWETWNWESLPIIPPQIKTEPIDDPYRLKQLKTIKELSQDVNRIVIATDAAIEGTLIYSLIKMHLKLNKPEYRLWTASLQPEAIRKAYQEMKPHSEYKGLIQMGFARVLSDYIIGLSGTRAMTLRVQDCFNNTDSNTDAPAAQTNNSQTLKAPVIPIGRTMVPVLTMVYDRCMEREKFKKIKYYPITGTFIQNNTMYKAALRTEKITDKSKATLIQQSLQNKQGLITDIKVQEKQTVPPGLLDLTTISKIANSRFGYKGTHVTETLESLYLKRYVSYPRTDENIVGEAEIALMHRSFDVLKEAYPKYAANGDKSLVSADNKRICRPDLLKDHHAILPEAVIPKNLTEDEQNIYNIVLERFFAQFYPAHRYIQKQIETEVENLKFDASFNQDIELGWKAIFKSDDEEAQTNEEAVTELPEVQLGAVMAHDIQMDEKETKPAALYTDGSLMDAMKNVGKTIEDPELRAKIRDKGIGTSATRSETIKKLVSIEYLAYRDKHLVVTKRGKTVVELLRKSNIKLLCSPALTAVWEKELDEIQNGKSSTPFMNGIYAFAHQIVKEAKSLVVNKDDFFTYVGKCPKCKEGLIETAKKYTCSKAPAECDFFIWKEQYKKSITPKMLEQLLTKGITNSYTFTSKKDEKYKAKLSLDLDKTNGYLKMVF